MDQRHAHRKDEHVFIAEKQFNPQSNNGLDQIRILPNNLPEIAIEEVDYSTSIAGKKSDIPFFINAMSGGSPSTTKLNQKLALAAKQTGLAMATGSQSIAVKFPDASTSFQIVRDTMPNGFVIGNLGAGNDLYAAKKAVKMISADALEIHLNAIQEIIMPEGDRNFYWREKIADIVANVDVPVIIKEVGFGISPATLKKLKEINVRFVDLSGYGGTNFAKIENQRLHTENFDCLNDFGMNIAECLIASKPYANDFSFTASGGIRNALDIVKCLCLGADNVGISGLFLHTVLKEDVTGLVKQIEDLKHQVKSIMTILGCHNISELRKVHTILSKDLLNFKNQIY
ncbi:type 2 isopentenyl-diphosphate Delta-isomerase [Liquorilactobacillus hordei]|uniref:Isopentenyl-diphosphate delta-isomerase n=1 Tax=Liquorilactobacillus hordei DSM 19519 TaxID=1423759 RepID=A0A0R1ML95_9LACO|nr:type 2 isopentenyl-diphosphate Delta-isomerase [Liquorilactobacillus hordei]KRL06724.1 isopentenyl pyrophosphate isomerase [Liquorilactobacillus hordei DSM 19519]QYH52281.1 type 2 isopentenyl-diphosphate Delta-isomerase [Liquorilactobacillus hordei DSM 19519]